MAKLKAPRTGKGAARPARIPGTQVPPRTPGVTSGSMRDRAGADSAANPQDAVKKAGPKKASQKKAAG